MLCTSWLVAVHIVKCACDCTTAWVALFGRVKLHAQASNCCACWPSAAPTSAEHCDETAHVLIQAAGAKRGAPKVTPQPAKKAKVTAAKANVVPASAPAAATSKSQPAAASGQQGINQRIIDLHCPDIPNRGPHRQCQVKTHATTMLKDPNSIPIKPLSCRYCSSAYFNHPDAESSECSAVKLPCCRVQSVRFCPLVSCYQGICRIR